MPTPKNIYELRSEEAQEILNRPPSILIVWGNTVILCIVLFTVIAANLVKLPINYEARYSCIKSTPTINKDISAVSITTTFNPSILRDLNFKTKIQLFPDQVTHGIPKYLFFDLNDNKLIAIDGTLSGLLRSNRVKEKSTGRILIQSGEETIVVRIYKKLKEL